MQLSRSLRLSLAIPCFLFYLKGMPSNMRILIDFSTGENWETPVWVYDIYQNDLLKLKGLHPGIGVTFIQFWLSILPADNRGADPETIKKPLFLLLLADW